MNRPLAKQAATQDPSALWGRSIWDDDSTFTMLLAIDGAIGDLNPPMAANLGRSAEELRGTIAGQFMLPENRIRPGERPAVENVIHSD